MEVSATGLKAAYYCMSVILIGLLGWNGWRQGAARQAMTLVSIASAYLAAWFGAWGGYPLGLPHPDVERESRPERADVRCGGAGVRELEGTVPDVKF